MMESSWKITARTIALSLILGGAAGVLTTALTTNYLSSYALELGELTEPLRLAEERPRSFPQSYEEAIAEVTEKVTPGIVEFYASASGAVSASEADLHGIALTSDGWLLTVSDTPSSLLNQRALIGGEMFPVEEVVADEIAGVVFVKINAENLPVLSFGSGRSLTSGEQVFTVPRRGGLLATSIVGFDWGEDVRWSSDMPNRYISMAQEAGATLGVPLANIGGELVGLVVSEDPVRVLPIESVLPAFTALLREGEVVRPSLGVEVIDLTHSLGLSDEITRGYHAGALIPDAAAISRPGAAREAGLEAGDILLSVNGQVVNGNQTLDEYILQYEPEDTITLTVDRDGEEISVDVVLGVL